MIDESRLIDNLKKEWEELCDYSENVETLLEYVIRFIGSQPKIGGWIPCSEKLPEEKGWYLVYAKNQRPFVAYFKGKTFPLNNHYHEIVAWMPLPEPYEEKENG